MRRLLRWMIVLGVLVGLVWASASHEVRGKTPFGHALVWWKKQDFFAEKEKKPAPKKKPKKEVSRPGPISPPKKSSEEEATPKRVALLEKAAQAAQAIERDRGNPGAKTVIGEQLSPSDKKALDELLTSKVARRE